MTKKMNNVVNKQGCILIVDDESQMRKKYRKFLEKENFQVFEAANALDAVEVLMREASVLDLIVLDINIAEVNGRDIFDIIVEYSSKIKVIVSSVYPINEQKLRIPKANDYFNKASKEELLVEKIRGLIGMPSY